MLERAFDAGFANCPYLEHEGDLRPLHSDLA
jgi:hypothetical protein